MNRFWADPEGTKQATLRRVAYMDVGEGREQERKAWQSCQGQVAGRPVVRHTDHYLRLPP